MNFLEYSWNIPWNIPYSRIFNISVVMIFFWNIRGIFHIPKISYFFLWCIFFGIFHIPINCKKMLWWKKNGIINTQKNQKNKKTGLWCSIFWNIPGIFHIPKKIIFLLWWIFFGIFHFMNFHIPFNIPRNIPWKFHAMFHIPRTQKMIALVWLSIWFGIQLDYSCPLKSVSATAGKRVRTFTTK